MQKLQVINNDVDFSLIDIYTYEFGDEKEYKKFINNCKRLIRSSLEYTQWVQYIKDSKQLCQFTHETTYALTIDLHHHPYSLNSIVRLVIDSHLSKFGKTTTFDVAKEVMNLHYKNYIGYVLLIKSLHEKFHNGYLTIPIELCSGNWQEIEKLYVLPNDIQETINKYKEQTINNVPVLKWDQDYVIYEE